MTWTFPLVVGKRVGTNHDYRSYTFLVLINKRFHQRSAINYMDFVHWLGPRHTFTPSRSHSKLLLSYFATELRLTSKLVRTQSANNGHLITLINTTFQKKCHYYINFQLQRSDCLRRYSKFPAGAKNCKLSSRQVTVLGTTHNNAYFIQERTSRLQTSQSVTPLWGILYVPSFVAFPMLDPIVLPVPILLLVPYNHPHIDLYYS